jgi:isoleucyl-tRNA synthetase
MLELDRWAVDRALQLQGEITAAYADYQFHLIAQKVQNFCVNEMGGFYLDIIKDRQYTTQADSLARRSCQTAMYHTVQAMARWLAPILSFTADEIWQQIPGHTEGTTVFTESWYDRLFELDPNDPYDRAFWIRVIAVRNEVSKHLEESCKEGAIGSSLDAEVDLYCDEGLSETLAKLEDELRFVLITSYARLHPIADKPAAAVGTEIDGLFIQVTASNHAKCERCWHHREDVGSKQEHPQLCGRCVDNIDGDGEPRGYA